MRKTIGLAFLLLIGSAVLGAYFGDPIAQAAKQVTDVFVTNDASNPVSVHETGTANVAIQGSPTVTIAGTAKVQSVEQPFQQFVSGQYSGNGEDCDQITPPAGMTLRIDSFNVEGNGATKPDIYLLVVVGQSNGANFVRSVVPELQQRGSDWVGTLATELWTGPANDPGNIHYSYSACIGGGSQFATYRGFVSGTLTPSG